MGKSNTQKITPMAPPPPPMIPKNSGTENHYLASEFYARLVEVIVDFEIKLNNDEEVGVRLGSFGETIITQIDDLGYCNPSLIYFYGRDNNDREVQLVQHVSQLNVLLIKVPRVSKERERIGFKMQKKQNESND